MNHMLRKTYHCRARCLSCRYHATIHDNLDSGAIPRSDARHRALQFAATRLCAILLVILSVASISSALADVTFRDACQCDSNGVPCAGTVRWPAKTETNQPPNRG